MYYVQWYSYDRWETLSTHWFRWRAIRALVKKAFNPIAVFHWRLCDDGYVISIHVDVRWGLRTVPALRRGSKEPCQRAKVTS